VRVSLFGPVKDSHAAQRAGWLEQARQAGWRLRRGVRTRRERVRDKALVWLKAMRLQFYPMTWLAYTMGALGLAALGGTLEREVYWLGYGFLFFLEVTTVFLNDYFDFESDRHNQHAGPFSGGSRVLVEKQLSFGEMRAGIATAAGLTLLFAALLLWRTPASSAVTLALLVAAALLTLGYTVPPLRLAYRGAAELDVCLTHSVLLVFCGYLFQGGAWRDALPWLLSVPLFLAGIPSITLAGIPDRIADSAVSKRTLAVMLGARRAALFALLATLVSALAAALWQFSGAAHGVFAGLAYFVLPHALLLSFLLLRQLQRDRLNGRIDLLMVVSLSYLLWFGAVPAFHLWHTTPQPQTAELATRRAQERAKDAW
jgi:4-hydroxybenzoate polyprenyltransferase